MEKKELLYEGKAKRLFLTEDNLTAFNGEKMDKDRFRQSLGGLKVSYEQVLERILG